MEIFIQNNDCYNCSNMKELPQVHFLSINSILSDFSVTEIVNQ